MSEQLKSLPLRDLQLWMKWVITDPRGVTAALENPFPSVNQYSERYTAPKPSALSLIENTPPLSVDERLSIYAEGYFSRILEALKNDFKITHKVLGQFPFQKLVADYLKAYPSRTFNLNEVGKNLFTFVEKYRNTDGLAFLPDIVEMEWRRVISFYAIEPQEINQSKFLDWTEEEWCRSTFKFHPSAFLLCSKWPLDELWSSQEQREICVLKAQGVSSSYYLMFRSEGVVELGKISKEEYLCLQNLMNGCQLSVALERVTQSAGTDENLNENLMSWFGSWIQTGLICDVVLNEKVR